MSLKSASGNDNAPLQEQERMHLLQVRGIAIGIAFLALLLIGHS